MFDDRGKPKPSRTQFGLHLDQTSEAEAYRATTFSCANWSSETRLFVKSARKMGVKKSKSTTPLSPNTKAKRVVKRDERFKEIIDAAADDLWATRGSRPSNLQVPTQEPDDSDDYLQDGSDDE